MAGGLTAMNKIDSCKVVKKDLTDVYSRMFAAYSSTQLMTNSMTVLMGSFSNMTTLTTALYAGDFKTIGTKTGEIFFTLFGNEEIGNALT